uniref:SGNH hydrolase-type esterase domain-containing protein n=1 Tax=Magnetospirillum gryphiswaldense TaxID=55518 RepID=A4TTW3_9PROT|nr:conserved hypothetical protein [Magnetospirillum gryphiswaldense MSR-1]
MTGADDHDEENVMRRRRSRNRSETASPALAFGKLPRLLLLLVVLLPIAEWSASAIMARLDSRAKAVTLSDDDIVKLYGTDQPAQYREALAEMPQAHDGTYAPLTEYRMPARQGRHLTIDGQGIRGGVMGADGPRVVVFGGSTAFGHGLTDGETIAAIMAAKLAQDGRPARVENRATPGWYSTQDRIAFAEMLATGDKPDVAVFIHGVDDFLSCGKPERTAWSARLARVGIPAGLETVVRQSALAALVRRLTGMPEPSGPVPHNPACASDSQAEASLARLGCQPPSDRRHGRTFRRQAGLRSAAGADLSLRQRQAGGAGGTPPDGTLCAGGQGLCPAARNARYRQVVGTGFAVAGRTGTGRGQRLYRPRPLRPGLCPSDR